MQATISGVGVWGPGFYNFEHFRDITTNGLGPDLEIVSPKPERIPARERRRAPLMVKLAVEVADQACTQAGFDPSYAHCVFSSGIGDADTTDYMCRILAGSEKLLSPTKFHNSVHNAAAGYWSISTGCEMAATFIGGMHNSFSMALFEAMIQITTMDVPVLVVMSDLPVPKPLWDMHPINDAFGCAFLLSPPLSVAPSEEVSGTRQVTLVTEVAESEWSDWPDIGMQSLADLYQSSPSAKALCMLEALVTIDESALKLPLSDGLQSRITISAATGLEDSQKISNRAQALNEGLTEELSDAPLLHAHSNLLD